MVRRHGWQLPAHAFQVVAITVFFLLVVAYYVFFAPFIGSSPFHYGAIALYSPLALAVFVLYVRCTGVNPADSGVFTGQEQKFSEMNDIKGLVSESSGSVIHRQGSTELPTEADDVSNRSVLSTVCMALCGWVVVPDGCRREPSPTQQPSLEEDVLYCTLCNAEVHKFSKHCRSCDKCVDGFDHHCRWLNNCVGRKNYASFVALMATSLLLLILQWGTGIAVIVRCFVDKRATNHQIVDKLGNGFSRAPFAAVVASCTAVSLLASVPLGELFFFHIILMRKGITTYEYVVAMRAQNEQPGVSVEGDLQSVPSSPGSSTATGLTGSSSLGLQYRGAWCTPPRVFVEHQDEVIPHLEPGRVPSTVDPDSVPKLDKKSQKRPVKISAWKLAKLDPTEAAKAAAKARANSTVVRQVPGRGVEPDYSSSDVGSSRSSASTDFGIARGKRADLGRFSASRLAMPNSREEFNIQFDSGDGVTSSRSSMSSPRHVLNESDGLSPLPSKPNYAPAGTLRLSTPRSAQANVSPLGVRISNFKPPLPFNRATTPSQKYTSWAGKLGPSDGSSLDSIEDRTPRFLGRQRVFDHGSGRNDVGGRSSVFSYIRRAWPEVNTSSYDVEKAQRPGAPTSTARENPATLQNMYRKAEDLSRRADDLLYPENSIFFGGPLQIPGTARSSSQESTSSFNPSSISGPEPAVPRQSRPPVRGSTARSHSPVFLPRSSIPGGYPPF